MTVPFAAWKQRFTAAPLADVETLIGRGGVVVLAPHPDDESLGCGAILAEAARLGRRIALVALTDGEGSHRNSRAFPPERLAAIRREEQRLALGELGCGGADRVRLGLPDAGTVEGARFRDAAAAIVRVCDDVGATALFATWERDPHCDHETAARLAAEVGRLRPALRIFSYPIWAIRLADDEPVDVAGLLPFRVDAGPHLAAKRRAVACHASQFGTLVGDDPGGFRIEDWFLDWHLGPAEHVFWHAKEAGPPDPAHFAALYAADPDPWRVADSAYEIGKRADALGLLGAGRWRRVVELGCGGGYLAAELAGRADAVLAADADASVIDTARRTQAGVSNLAFARMRVPAELPEGGFDLLVLSEIVYYLREAEIALLAEWMEAGGSANAECLLVDYLGKTDTPLSGDDGADLFLALAGGWRRAGGLRTERYRIDRLVRR